MKLNDKVKEPVVDVMYPFKANITLTLPRKCVVSNLKWVSVWCRKFRANFGDVIADFTLDNTDNSAEDSQPRDSPKRLIGNFTNKRFPNCAGPKRSQQCDHGVSGQVFALDEQTLMIKGFTYSSTGRCTSDTFFLAGIKGDKPPPNKKSPVGKSILLTFDNTIYSYKDPNAPGIAESFDGVRNLNDIVIIVNKPDEWYFSCFRVT